MGNAKNAVKIVKNIRFYAFGCLWRYACNVFRVSVMLQSGSGVTPVVFSAMRRGLRRDLDESVRGYGFFFYRAYALRRNSIAVCDAWLVCGPA